MRSVPTARRVSAIVALLAVVVLIATVALVLARNPLGLFAAIVCLAAALAAGVMAVTRTGARRLGWALVAVTALAAALVVVVTRGRPLLLLLLIPVAIVAGAASRHALGRVTGSHTSGATPGVRVGPAARPVLFMNPKSGGGKVERFHLVEEAERRGIEPVVLGPGADVLQLAERAVGRGADVLGIAGGDGSQALVAASPCAATSPSSACRLALATTWPWILGLIEMTSWARSTHSERRWSDASTWG